MNRLTIMIITICSLALGQTTDLFFSEYAEGSSNNKYIEIYNGTGTDVDLSGYSLSSCSNGCNTTDEWDYPDNVTFICCISWKRRCSNCSRRRSNLYLFK